METLQQTRDVCVWFFKKLRERGRDKSYLKPLDKIVEAIDKYLQSEDIEDEKLNELNNTAIDLMNETINREQSEFDMKPEYTPEELNIKTEELNYIT